MRDGPRVTDIFEEVEERLREDQLQTWWKKYGNVAMGAAVAAVLLVGFSGVFTTWRASVNQSQGERFAALQKTADADPAASAQAFKEFQKSAHGGYKALAEMERAGALQAQGDLRGALAAFDDAAKLAQQPIVKQSAQMRAAYIAADIEDFAALDARLKPLIDSRGPYSYLARELAGVEAYEAGKPERARSEFTYLQGAFDAPNGVRNRASGFLAVLGPAPETPASTPAPASSPTPAPAPAAPASAGDKK